MSQINVTATARLPTRHGEFAMDTFRYGDDPVPHLALVVGNPGGDETPLSDRTGQSVTAGLDAGANVYKLLLPIFTCRICKHVMSVSKLLTMN